MHPDETLAADSFPVEQEDTWREKAEGASFHVNQSRNDEPTTKASIVFLDCCQRRRIRICDYKTEVLIENQPQESELVLTFLPLSEDNHSRHLKHSTKRLQNLPITEMSLALNNQRADA